MNTNIKKLTFKTSSDNPLKHTQPIPWSLAVKSLDVFGDAVLSGLRGENNFKSTKVKNVYVYN